MAAKDMKGKTIGRLTVIERSGSERRGRALWLCVCECGNEKIIRGERLRDGTTQSCGCLRLERASAANTKHGLCGLPEYSVWERMKYRCGNQNDDAYKHYGGRGIRVCAEWTDDFVAFYSDMGDRPSPKHTVDRIDNDGDYTPGNCRWATPAQQARNTRRNRWVTYRGETKVLTDWARILGMCLNTLKYRITNSDWTLEQAMTTPIGQPKK